VDDILKVPLPNLRSLTGARSKNAKTQEKGAEKHKNARKTHEKRTKTHENAAEMRKNKARTNKYSIETRQKFANYFESISERCDNMKRTKKLCLKNALKRIRKEHVAK
jgi:hypothetical protein